MAAFIFVSLSLPLANMELALLIYFLIFNSNIMLAHAVVVVVGDTYEKLPG
jgi:hypothetical protein